LPTVSVRQARPSTDLESFPQHTFEVRPHDAQQRADGEAAQRHSGSATSFLVDKTGLGHPVGDLLDLGQQAHGPDRVVTRAEEVDHVSLFTRRLGLFEHRHFDTQCRQAVRQCQACDPGTTDDHSHRSSS
jgi:hypothetical protein